jgi:hypothetical protein
VKRYLKHIGASEDIVFYNRLSWFVSELPEKDISNMEVQCMAFYNKLPSFVSELLKKI